MNTSTDIDIRDWRAFAASYAPHPMAALFPMMPPSELEDLWESIAAEGLVFPIVLDDDMRVVDGRNRLAAMILHDESMPAPRFARFHMDGFYDADGTEMVAAIDRAADRAGLR